MAHRLGSERWTGVRFVLLVLVCVLAACGVFGAGSAFAAGGPVWKIVSVSEPTNLPPSGEGRIVVKAVNVGDGQTDGSAVTVTASLGPGLTATSIAGGELYNHKWNPGGFFHGITCSAPPVLSCSYPEVVATGDMLEVVIGVSVGAGVSSVTSQASVVGGGAEGVASASAHHTVSATAAAPGLAPGSLVAATSTRQAGAHPDVTTAFTLSTIDSATPAGNLKDVRFDLPPGLVGNTVGIPQCQPGHIYECPSDTIVGTSLTTTHSVFFPHGDEVWQYPVFNLAPSPGEPAAFEFFVGFAPVRLDTSVLSDGNYAVRVGAADLSELLPVLASSVTIWGIPADHEGPGPLVTGQGFSDLGGPLPGGTRVPLLSNPTQCAESLTAGLSVDQWGAPGVFDSASVSMGTPSGCGVLGFSGSMSMLPDTLEAGEPAGYSLDLHVPQNDDPNALARPDVKRVVTALPMGAVISPSAAWGLQACSDEEFYGPVAERGLQRPASPGACPRESQVGTVTIRTPALELPLAGQVFLASPDCGPCSPQDAQGGRMVRLFLQVVGEGDSGIVVKLEGHGQINQQTGQLTVTFDNNPQLPFSDFKLTLGGGSRATLANPRLCGLVGTSMDLTPWSSPFTTDVSLVSSFEVNEGCITPRFAPSFVAGTTSIQAGEYSPFTVSFGRSDQDEFLNGLQMQMPPGMLGSLAGIPLCREPQAAEGTCGQGSLIGHTQALTGPGQTPFLVTGGEVFLTEGYKGAPFGLSIVVPAKAGPYTLSGTTGHGTVVVRAAINIDPNNAALTVTSDPLPTALDGIPLQLRVVNVTVDRPGFTLNPTSCDKMSITGTLTSKESGGVSVASPFQVTNCAALGFKPMFKVSTSGRTSRVNGASLDAKVAYPSGAKLANIAKVKVSLPKQLPSRLTTLQKACPASTFDANPAGCPAASVVGIAKATTPILPVGLSGPVYFVSHGGEAFPNLIVVLQGYGVRVDLVGDTFISKAGITSSTFNQVPDVPINSFELFLPQGPYSALAANGNLCKQSLLMPTMFTAQNGMVLKQATKITVTGCGKAKTAKKAKKAKRARKARKARRARRAHAAREHHQIDRTHNTKSGQGGRDQVAMGRGN
jgi:hypothetical protein